MHEEDIERAAFALSCRRDLLAVVEELAANGHISIAVVSEPDGTGIEQAWFRPDGETYSEAFRAAASKITLRWLRLMAEDFGVLAQEATGQDVEFIDPIPEAESDG
jgi:hypothetical protein